MFEIVKANYLTYRNDGFGTPERHFGRLGSFVIIAAVVGLVSDFPSTDTFALLVTFLSVLTGFVFTALFSDHALAEAGLPSPCNESDRMELRRLKALGINLTRRAKFFILVSLLCCATTILANFGFSWLSLTVAEANYSVIIGSVTIDVSERLTSTFKYFHPIALVAILILSFEAAYTFYRLAETMLSVLSIRRDYLSANR